MPSNVDLSNRVREARRARRWSQEELARRAGVSRASVSAIEVGRLVPSTAAALAVARALGCRVEDLFLLPAARDPDWAWSPSTQDRVRYWMAEVDGRPLAYAVEPGASSTLPHDGVTVACGRPRPDPDGARRRSVATPMRTLVMAGCDPAAGLLGAALAGEAQVRLLPFARSSRAALELLRERRVHLAGLHLGVTTTENREVARRILGPGYRLVHLVRWTEGVVLSPGLRFGTVGGAVAAGLQWVSREDGSGARLLMDELLAGAGRWEQAEGEARDHRAVAEAVRAGWAQAGICVQLASEEAGLPFLPVRTEAYDLCYPEDLEGDPRLEALLRVVRSPSLRSLFSDLPGYDARGMGEAA